MKRFYNYKRNKFNIYFVAFVISIIFVYIFFSGLGVKLGNSITLISKLKIDEITKYNLNNIIKNYKNINTNNYINLNIVNNNIINVDIDNYNTNILLNDILNDIEDSIVKLENGDINKYNNLEIINGNNGIVIMMPIGVMFGNSLLSGLGPSIPIKVSFLENIDIFANVEVNNYGINNTLINLYINIDIEEVLEMPIKNRKSHIKYKYLISSKIINGQVPNLLGSNLNSNIVNKSVN